MAKVRMTERFVAGVKAGEVGGRSDYFDTVTKGLVLRVSPGRKSWCLFYSSPSDGKRARVGLGSYPAVGLADARAKAIEAAGHVADGSDPRRKMKASASMTVADLVTAYLNDPKKAKLRTVDEIGRRLRRDVLPVIGDIRITDIARRDVRNVIEPIERSGKAVAARRSFEDVRAMMRWAVEHEYLTANPIAGMQGPEIKAPRERVLSDSEIGELWAALPRVLPLQYQWIVKLCLVTGQRLGEISGMARPELQLDRGEWHLHGARTKNANPHIVPLSDLAMQLIEQALAGGGPFVFPHQGGGRPSVMVSAMVSTRNQQFGIAPWGCHDLRRTALTGMASLGVAPIVLGHVANHLSTTKAGVTLAVYSKYNYSGEKRSALNLWADRVAAIVGGQPAAAVVPLRARP
jgi:integrase